MLAKTNSCNSKIRLINFNLYELNPARLVFGVNIIQAIIKTT